MLYDQQNNCPRQQDHPFRNPMTQPKKKTASVSIRSSAAEYLTYASAIGDQKTSVELRYEEENLWLTQKLMAELYNVDVRTVNEHLKNLFASGELEENSVIRNFRITASDGKNYNTMHYNLQAVLSVGFKIENQRAVQFRKWARDIVKEFAETEFEKYRIVQDQLFESDFDRFAQMENEVSKKAK